MIFIFFPFSCSSFCRQLRSCSCIDTTADDSRAVSTTAGDDTVCHERAVLLRRKLDNKENEINIKLNKWHFLTLFRLFLAQPREHFPAAARATTSSVACHPSLKCDRQVLCWQLYAIWFKCDTKCIIPVSLHKCEVGVIFALRLRDIDILAW